MSSPDELLQRAARMVVDGDKEVGAVAQAFGVNEKHLEEAVWYMKENRQREANELLQRAARIVVDGDKEIGAVAQAFGVNEKHLGEAVWYMKENRQRARRRRAERHSTDLPAGPPTLPTGRPTGPPPEGCYWKQLEGTNQWVPVRAIPWQEDPS